MMDNPNLRKYYEMQYLREILEDDIVSDPRFPSSRYQALEHYFPKYFKGGSVLELAAGDGKSAKALLKQNQNIESYTVSEYSKSAIKILNEIKEDRLSVLEINAEDIDSNKLGKYEAVIMLTLIEHLIDPITAMKNIRALVRPGGFVYIDTPNFAKFTRRIKLLFGRFPGTATLNEGLTTYWGEPAKLYDEGHLHYFTYRSLSLMLTEICGFSEIVKLSYPVGLTFRGKQLPMGYTLLDKQLHFLLAKFWPEMFSELLILAYV